MKVIVKICCVNTLVSFPGCWWSDRDLRGGITAQEASLKVINNDHNLRCFSSACVGFFLNKQSSNERSNAKTCDRNEEWGSVSWPVVKEDVWGPNLVWGEPQVLDARVAFWIPAQVDIRPVLWQREASFYTIVCQTFYKTVARSIKRHAKGQMFPVRNKLQSYYRKEMLTVLWCFLLHSCSSWLQKRKHTTL